MKIYLAGPDVFRPDAVEFGKSLVKSLNANFGMTGLYPLDNEINDENLSKLELANKIFLANKAMIDECDAVLANVQPFRGPSADTGTVWECAYAKGIGKLVWGYNIPQLCYKTRVVGNFPHDGMTIEDFNIFDNLMLVYGLDGYSPTFHEAALSIKWKLNSANSVQTTIKHLEDWYK